MSFEINKVSVISNQIFSTFSSLFPAATLIMKAVFEKYIEEIINQPHSGGIFKASRLP